MAFPSYIICYICYILLIIQQLSGQDISTVEDTAIPPIFILNLDRSPDRWQRVSDELNKANVIFHRFPAVDGRAIPANELMNATTFMSRMLQPRGVIGKSCIPNWIPVVLFRGT